MGVLWSQAPFVTLLAVRRVQVIF